MNKFFHSSLLSTTRKSSLSKLQRSDIFKKARKNKDVLASFLTFLPFSTLQLFHYSILQFNNYNCKSFSSSLETLKALEYFMKNLPEKLTCLQFNSISHKQLSTFFNHKFVSFVYNHLCKSILRHLHSFSIPTHRI